MASKTKQRVNNASMWRSEKACMACHRQDCYHKSCWNRDLQKQGYIKSKATPSFWTHAWRPISFTLVVDDFGVKYVVKEHADHLVRVLKEQYEISKDWGGKKYIGITFDWDYIKRQVHVSMPGYVNMAFIKFKH